MPGARRGAAGALSGAMAPPRGNGGGDGGRGGGVSGIRPLGDGVPGRGRFARLCRRLCVPLPVPVLPPPAQPEPNPSSRELFSPGLYRNKPPRFRCGAFYGDAESPRQSFQRRQPARTLLGARQGFPRSPPCPACFTPRRREQEESEPPWVRSQPQYSNHTNHLEKINPENRFDGLGRSAVVLC